MFPQFSVYLNVTQAKQMISLLLLNNSIERSKETESEELLYTVLVARYGPRTSCQRKGLKVRSRLFLRVPICSEFCYGHTTYSGQPGFN